MSITLNRYSYVNNNPLKYTDPTGHVAWIPVIIIGAGATFGATEAVSAYTLSNPNATWQDKAKVAAGGAIIGGAATTATLVAGPSVIGGIVIGAASSGIQQVYTNAITGQRMDQNVISQAATGGIFGGVVGKVVNKLDITGKTVGRPVDINKNRTLSQSLSKNSANAITRATIPELFNTAVKIITNSLFTLFSNNK